jgi:pimeloyl-ACP methyl ester carboxylesterase
LPVLIALLVLLLVIVLVGLYFARVIIYPKNLRIEASYQREVENGKLVEAEFGALPKREVFVRSPYGYNLYGFYIPCEGSQKTVILVHGIYDTLYGSVKYINLFRKRGFNVLLYEQRNHGRNLRMNTTYGFYEKYDLMAVVDWALVQLGPDGVVGTLGESLGGAVALQHCAIDPRVAFVIADCPYSDLTQLFTYLLKRDYHLPPFPLLYIADFFCRVITGFSFTNVSPIREIAAIKTPIFWTHGENDIFIPPQMSIEMYNAKRQGIKKLFTAPNARHVEAFWNNQQEYDRQVGEFLAEAGFWKENDIISQVLVPYSV